MKDNEFEKTARNMGDKIKVVMVNTTDKKPRRSYKQTIKRFDELQRTLTIPENASVVINKSGYEAKFYVDTVSVLVGIGKDHTAELIMDVDAWEAFKNNEPLSTDTMEEFKEKYL